MTARMLPRTRRSPMVTHLNASRDDLSLRLDDLRPRLLDATAQLGDHVRGDADLMQRGDQVLDGRVERGVGDVQSGVSLAEGSTEIGLPASEGVEEERGLMLAKPVHVDSREPAGQLRV